MKASVFVGTSLDGFIARENGDLDWLTGSDESTDTNHGFKEFFDTVDVLVMGRNTYEKVLTFDKWYYGAKPVVVLTTRPLDIPQSTFSDGRDHERRAGRHRAAARGAWR
jgi:dihydrofolate reductase